MVDPSEEGQDSPVVQAVTACRQSFNEFWDKLLTVVETDVEASSTKLMVKLAKSMFLNQFPETYTDEETGWTDPSDIVEAVQLIVIGTDIVGDGAAFGLLLNEMECMLRDDPVTTEFQQIEGGTYGELLRMVAIRFILEFLKEDEEVLEEQSRRIQLANEANTAAGLTGPHPPRKGLSKQYLRTWEQLKRFWLNQAQFADLFRDG